MAKYEIMLILDPKEDLKVAEKIVNEVFKGAKFTKMDRTELAYEIKKSKTATYVLVNTEANGADIKEFIRRTNITKSVWRIMIVNLDSEMGRDEALSKIAARKEKLAQERAEAMKAREAEGKDGREPREGRYHREPREGREPREYRESREPREHRTPREGK